MLAFIGFGAKEIYLLYILLVIPLWTIFQKSGRSPWLSLIALIPILGLFIALYIAAYAKWKMPSGKD